MIDMTRTEEKNIRPTIVITKVFAKLKEYVFMIHEVDHRCSRFQLPGFMLPVTYVTSTLSYNAVYIAGISHIYASWLNMLVISNKSSNTVPVAVPKC